MSSTPTEVSSDPPSVPKPQLGHSGLDTVEYEAVSSTYFDNVVNQGLSARARASAGFAIISAISGALIAFGFSGSVSDAGPTARHLTVIGIALWATAALCFLVAAILPPHSKPLEPHEASEMPRELRPKTTDIAPEEFVTYAFESAKADSRRVGAIVLVGTGVAAAATVVTVISALLVIVYKAGPDTTNAVVTVDSSFFHEYEDRCQVTVTGSALRDLVGIVDQASIANQGTDYLDFTPAPASCATAGKFEIPRADVVDVEEYACPLLDISAVTGRGSDPIVPCTYKRTPIRDIFRKLIRR